MEEMTFNLMITGICLLFFFLFYRKDKREKQIILEREKEKIELKTEENRKRLAEIEREKKQREDLFNKVKNTLISSELNNSDWQKRLNYAKTQSLESIKNVEKNLNDAILFRNQLKTKYRYLAINNLKDFNDLLDIGYFIGMTEQMAIDTLGKPHKVKKEVLLSKTKISYIYYENPNTYYANLDKVLVFEENKLVSYRNHNLK